MNTSLSADHLLRIAQQIERNAAHFYRQAAEECFSMRCTRALVQLAAWEEQHEKLLADMQMSLQGQQFSAQLTQETQQYLDGAIAGVPEADIFNPLAGAVIVRGRRLDDVLEMAIELEKKSILFYLGLQHLLVESEAQTAMEIIRQEMKHVALLHNELTSLREAQRAPS